jgi:hypothetical protein
MINTPMLSWRAGNDPGSRIKDLVSSLCILLGASFCFFDRVFLFVDLKLGNCCSLISAALGGPWLVEGYKVAGCLLSSVICHLIYLLPIPSISEFNHFLLKFFYVHCRKLLTLFTCVPLPTYG